MNRFVGLIATVTGAVLLAACGGGRVVVYTPATPSPVVSNSPSPAAFVVSSVPATPAIPRTVATLGPSPGSDYIRIEGYYNWLGDHYEWVPATWARIPRAGATYVPGHWQSAPTGGYSWL
jgi:hypothetical protein